MRHFLWLLFFSLLLIKCTPPQPAIEQSTHLDEISTEENEVPTELPGDLGEPIAYLTETLGKFERKITTDNAEAQIFFNQGIQLKYAFAVDEAVRSFRTAWQQDSTCAMCYYGEAWALGSYLNGAMSESKAPFALKAIRQAEELAADNATEVEKALIKAMRVRYIENYVRDERRVQDSLYALAMNEVYDQFPEDADVATIYAEALFILEPRRGTREMDDPKVMRIHSVLEKVIAKGVHPGACHLYIHATESTNQPELGESCADYIGNSIPGASHINHMPSHTWNEVGRWGESVQANIQAIKSDQKSKEGKAVAIYPTHNFHMLLYAASFDGQGAVATQAGKDFARETGNTMFQVMTLLRFGRFEEILKVESRPNGDIPAGIWDFCQGYARLKTGEADFAKVFLQRVMDAAEKSEDSFRFHPAKKVLGTLGAILEGEIRWAEGDLTGAVKSFQRGVKIEDSLTYDEPEIFPFAARHWLGALYLEQGRFSLAEKVYRAELEDHPHNGWSLFGLLEALNAQNKPAETEQADFDQSWDRSDIWIKSSKF